MGKSPIVEEGMRSHLRGRNRFLNVMTHDVVERLKIRRKALAADAGIDESYDVGTYPPEQTTVVVGGGMSKALIAGMMLVTGVAGGIGLSTLLSASPVGEDVVPAVSPASPVEFDVTIEEVDGRPVITDVKGVDNDSAQLRPDPGADQGRVREDP